MSQCSALQQLTNGSSAHFASSYSKAMDGLRLLTVPVNSYITTVYQS